MAMVWELIVLDAALQIANVDYEPEGENGGGPDFRLQFYDEKWVWIEATFRRVEVNGYIDRFSKHPIRRKLWKKEDQAKKAGIEGPLVVCLGTDRCRQYGHMHGPGEVTKEEAALSFLDGADYVSAALIAPSFSTFEVFSGLKRSTTPQLIEHPESNNPLSEQLKNYIVKMDFNRWPLSTDSSPNRSPVGGLIPPKGAPISLPEIPDYLLPYEEVAWSGAVYSYQWNFEYLRIVSWRTGYALINGNEKLMEAASREECAQVASEVFCPSCGLVIGPAGVEENPDSGVPSDLSKWTIISPK
ncbi:hypothetical protein PSDVSF_14030 [Pseudodesulfovibrio sediminis]|uniref:Restriction endonuclease type IV Mrr domain-containing protein n=1 Tax=Pseudodesulfovibrio sediminis TaxID=2810563 RepID=A0ABN6ESQ6_9BACT|nr:hypothetical protein PSDVSF_14030 [Pseudodesulfovibrio sediminis]